MSKETTAALKKVTQTNLDEFVARNVYATFRVYDDAVVAEYYRPVPPSPLSTLTHSETFKLAHKEGRSAAYVQGCNNKFAEINLTNIALI